MASRSMLIVKHPRDRVHEVLVERTWELAALLDDIDSAVLTDQSNAEPRRSATHEWRAKASVPPLLAPHIDDDYFRWTATVEWTDNEFQSLWRIEPHAVRESIDCTATVELEDAMGGRATRVSLDVAINGLGSRMGVETIAYRIVQTNWQKLVMATESYLKPDS